MMKPLVRAFVLVSLASAVSCSNSSGVRVTTGAGGLGGGKAGASGSAGTGGAAGNAGAGGAAGRGGNAGSGGAAGAGGHAGGTTGAGGAAGRVGTDAGTDAVSLDAGANCVAPSGEAPLDAAAAGLPATGLVLWLRGDHGVSKTAANAVCAWADQSGHAWTFTPYGARPSWSATGLSGLPAVRSTALGEGLSTAGVLGLTETSARTIIAVTQLVSAGGRFQALQQGQSGSPGTYLGLDANTYGTTGSREGVYMTNNAYDAALATTTTAPRVHVYTIQTMTPGTPVLSGIDYRVNGATQTLTRTSGGLGNGNFEDFSNANFTSVAGTSEGIVAEVLVYDRALTVTERAAVETALEARYGIQQDAGAPH